MPGVFSFQRVPSRMPRAGVETVEISRDSWAFIATPFRAIADMLYLNKKITWQRHGVSYLTESLRIELDDLRSFSYDGLDDILSSLRSHRVRTYLQRLKGALGHAG